MGLTLIAHPLVRAAVRNHLPAVALLALLLWRWRSAVGEHAGPDNEQHDDEDQQESGEEPPRAVVARTVQLVVLLDGRVGGAPVVRIVVETV